MKEQGNISKSDIEDLEIFINIILYKLKECGCVSIEVIQAYRRRAHAFVELLDTIKLKLQDYENKRTNKNNK